MKLNFFNFLFANIKKCLYVCGVLKNKTKMKKYWIKDLNEKQAIHAPTEGNREMLFDRFNELGLTWDDGEEYSTDNTSIFYDEDACFLPAKGDCGGLNTLQSEGCEIIKMSQLHDFANVYTSATPLNA